METRYVEQVKIHILTLNNMQCNTEQCQVVAISTSVHKIEEWYNSLLCESYKDIGFHAYENNYEYTKFFVKGSLLEWFNPCDKNFCVNCFGHGLSYQWIDRVKLEEIKQNYYFIEE